MTLIGIENDSGAPPSTQTSAGHSGDSFVHARHRRWNQEEPGQVFPPTSGENRLAAPELRRRKVAVDIVASVLAGLRSYTFDRERFRQ
jgi:hypothetical protein